MPNKLFWGFVTALIILGGTLVVLIASASAQSASNPQGDKYDAGCTGAETAGRCVDKCPNQTDTLLDFDPLTGAAICRAAPTGCPYGDSIPMDSAKCVAPVEPTLITSPEVESFQGK